MMFPGGLLLLLIFQIFTAGITAQQDTSSPVDGDIRLHGGNNSCSGTVEIFFHGHWGTVCGYSWDINDAEVVCRKMGCGMAVSAPRYAYFGPGTGPIWFDGINCRGNETSLDECPHGGIGNHYCSHYADAGVFCADNSSSVVEGDIRLVNGGNNNCSGTVEIFLYGYWGTVCDNFWDINDAEVVCTQIGCGEAVSAPHFITFGQGTGPILLKDVNCRGNETSLSECPRGGNGNHYCGQHEDAGIVCAVQQDNTSSAVDGDIRLHGGNNSCSGRVEIFFHGHWGTVCGYAWDINDAEVVCRQMGCGMAVSAPRYAYFGQGTGPIWFGDINCRGNETSLDECPHGGIGDHYCSHYSDVGVFCAVQQDNNSSAVDGDIRLVNERNSSCFGRVEIFLHGHWGTVCGYAWGINEAEVVCRQMGCGEAVSAPHYATFGQGSGPIFFDDVSCSGNETSLTECQHGEIGDHYCGHYSDVGVVCAVEQDNTSSAVDGDIRLHGGNNSCSGTVEVFFHGHWGTVCGYSWDINDAEVVCRQMGCGMAVSAPRYAYFGPGSGPNWFDGINCRGDETRLDECPHGGIGNHYCSHYWDAGVFCEVQQDNTSSVVEGDIRLVNGGNNNCSGTVEVFLHGYWGTVCGYAWDINDAEVVCAQIGCGRAVSAPHYAFFGQGTGPIWFDDISCSGNETSLRECQHGEIGDHYCRHYWDAGVVCAVQQDITSSAVDGDIRLVNERNSSCFGTVEIFLYGHWGTVQDYAWDLSDAEVVCRQIGCGEAVSAPQYPVFGQGTGPILLKNVNCRGNETRLQECQHGEIGNHYYYYYYGAGVVCAVQQDETTTVLPPTDSTTEATTTATTAPLNTSSAVDGEVNGGNSSCSGRVKVFHNGQWGTMCDDFWDINVTEVVCTQIDCARRLHNYQLICSPDKLQLGLDIDDPTSGLDALSGNLASHNCTWSRTSNGVVWYEVDALENVCGNTLMINNTHAIYSNTLFLYPNGNEFHLPESIPFSCAYPLDTDSSLDVVINPVLPTPGVKGSGAEATTTMSLFLDSTFTQTYPAGRMTLPLGSPLYVGVSVTGRDPRFVVVLQDCYATPSHLPQDPRRDFFIHNSCPTNARQVSLIESGRSQHARFVALLFVEGEEYRDIYLHCNIHLCDPRGSHCVPFCPSRTARSLPSSFAIEPVTIGPITWEKPRG